MNPVPQSASALAPPPPVHVAIIMDGNGRWATSRGQPRTFGHRKGAEAVRRTIEAAVDLGISYLTLYGFSLENWKRPLTEITDLMGLLRLYLSREIDVLMKNSVRIRFIGDRSRLPADVNRLIEESETRTRANARLTLIVAMSYGSRQEIVAATRTMARAAAAGKLDPEKIDEDAFARHLETADVPDPDLVIRTSGEKRVSNFLLWQLAYSELIFIDTLWPDFARADLEEAIREFHRRERRYGATAG